MWLTAPNQLGIAAWLDRHPDGDSAWLIEARGETSGICFRLGNQSLRLVSSDDKPLARLAEQYVRGNELHLSFPQEEGLNFGFRIAIEPLLPTQLGLPSSAAGSTGEDSNVGNPDWMLFEVVVSIQTSLLDSHPTLDLIAEGTAESADEGTLPNSIHQVSFASTTADSAHGNGFLSQHDAPFTTDLTEASRLQLRLFGEFLEKGVIRRARPWLLLSRSDASPNVDLAELWQHLNRRPVPLN